MTNDLPSSRREHRQTRRDAERRRAGFQREIKQLQRDARHEVRTVRRSAETATIVGRAKLTELAVQALAGLAARLHTRGWVGGTRDQWPGRAGTNAS